MTIQMTVTTITDKTITLIDVTGKEFVLPRELFSETPREEQNWWVTVSNTEPRTVEPKEILNEVLGTNS